MSILRTILDEYEKDKAALQKQKEQLKTASSAIGKQISEAYLQTVNKDVMLIHSSQKRINEEIRKLRAHTQEFTRQAHRWIELYDDLLLSLKEAGDVTNWFTVLSNRVVAIKSHLHNRKALVENDSDTSSLTRATTTASPTATSARQVSVHGEDTKGAAMSQESKIATVKEEIKASTEAIAELISSAKIEAQSNATPAEPTQVIPNSDSGTVASGKSERSVLSPSTLPSSQV